MNEGFFGDVQQGDSSPGSDELMFELDEELENLPSDRTFTSSKMPLENFFSAREISRPSNPVAYLLQNDQEDVNYGQEVWSSMSHFVSVATSAGANLHDDAYFGWRDDSSVALQAASDDFTTLCRVDDGNCVRKRKIHTLEQISSSAIVPPRRVKPRATRALSHAFGQNTVRTSSLAQPCSPPVEYSNHASKRQRIIVPSELSGLNTSLKTNHKVRAASYDEKVSIKASASIDIPRKNSNLSRDHLQLHGHSSFQSSSNTNSRTSITSSWRATASSFEYFCRTSRDITSPLRLRFQNLLVRSFGRTGTFDAS
uniref:AlNc14C6G900 protein n=1 Tax=Albugo laibachii Nc14 TaxID=890382 RepID=F0W1D1_9STRA|nr:AlNc14C6G900 [Albugo laibachii Nc14]|eukprot:CCA14859.1 AlNc14C6G900 [Albugo laibachii Nc14]